MDNGPTPQEIGLGLRSLREEAHLSQKELAKLAGISPTNLSGYENGKDLYVSTLVRLLGAMTCGFIDLDLAVRRMRGDRLVSIDDWHRALEAMRSDLAHLREQVEELQGGRPGA